MYMSSCIIVVEGLADIRSFRSAAVQCIKQSTRWPLVTVSTHTDSHAGKNIYSAVSCVHDVTDIYRTCFWLADSAVLNSYVCAGWNHRSLQIVLLVKSIKKERLNRLHRFNRLNTSWKLIYTLDVNQSKGWLLVLKCWSNWIVFSQISLFAGAMRSAKFIWLWCA